MELDATVDDAVESSAERDKATATPGAITLKIRILECVDEQANSYLLYVCGGGEVCSSW